MVVRYDGVPNKKRRVYVDEEGMSSPLGKRSGATQYFVMPGSGTLDSGGTTTVTGAQFKIDSVVVPSYRKSAAVSNSLAVEVTDGTATFKGDSSESFYYILVNVSFD